MSNAYRQLGEGRGVSVPVDIADEPPVSTGSRVADTGRRSGLDPQASGARAIARPACEPALWCCTSEPAFRDYWALNDHLESASVGLLYDPAGHQATYSLG